MVLLIIAALLFSAGADPCSIALDGPFAESARIPGALDACRAVASKAAEHHVDVDVAIALAFHETRFKDAPSHKGRRMLAGGQHNLSTIPGWVERTAMQCKPAHYCPRNAAGKLPSNWRESCDFLDACMAHLARQMRDPRVCLDVPKGAAGGREIRTCRMVGVGQRVCDTHTVRCSRVDIFSRGAMQHSLDRYHAPYGPAHGYGRRVLAKHRRFLAAQ